MLQKVKIFIIDDNPEDVEDIHSSLLAVEGDIDPYKEEKIQFADEFLQVDVRHSVPEAIEYLNKYSLPDIAIVDINFRIADQNIPIENEEDGGSKTSAQNQIGQFGSRNRGEDEGLYLVENLQQSYPGMYVFCVSNYLDLNQPRIEKLIQTEWAIPKKELPTLSRRIGEVLREIATRELASIEPGRQLKLWEQIKNSDWQALAVNTNRGSYGLKNMLSGWVKMKYNHKTGESECFFPENILEILKSLLPYVDAETIQSSDPG